MTLDHLIYNYDLPEINSVAIQSLKGNQRPVLVVGMHNSGTSILTEILHKNGIFFGANMQHFESNFFSIFINDRIILGGKGNWAKLPLMSVDEVLSFESSVGPFIKAHWVADYLQWGYDGKSHWGIKDPRLCVLLPLYLKFFPEATVIHIRRNPDDVAASLTGKFKTGVGILDDFAHWKMLTEAYTER
ncbi:MAG: sulfotransferase, partial [Anaerolineales bacterium]|nr:sulfotransferase [Anaerolineales bacterium]